MTSGVTTESLLSDLYLYGAKAPILATGQKINVGGGNVQAEFVPILSDPRQSPGTGRTRYENRNEDSQNDCADLKIGAKDDTSSLPYVHFEKNNILPKDSRQTCINKTYGLTSETPFPSAQLTTALVSVGAKHDPGESHKFGNIEIFPQVTESDSQSDDERRNTDSGQTNNLWLRNQPFFHRTSSSSRSSKENHSPHPPENKKKKVKRRQRKIKNVKVCRNNGNQRKPASKSTQTREPPVIPSTAPAPAHQNLKISCSPAVFNTGTPKPNTAQSTPDFSHSSFKQRENVYRPCKNTRQGCSLPSRSRTLPSVIRYTLTSTSTDIPGQVNEFSPPSTGDQMEVLRVRLSDTSNSKYVVSFDRGSSPERRTTAQNWGRLVKIYLSEKQSGSMKDPDGQTEYPCAPPATPTPDQLQKYSYIPSMNDIKAQRAVRNKLQVLERAELKRKEKERRKRAKAEQQVIRDNEKLLRGRQRQEIYALNAVMTALEHSRFVDFCKNHNIPVS